MRRRRSSSLVFELARFYVVCGATPRTGRDERFGPSCARTSPGRRRPWLSSSAGDGGGMNVARDAGGVLIVRPSSLGDIVYALAVVSDIRRERPALAVDWVAEQGFMPLIELCPDVRRVIAFGLRGWRKSPLAAATWRAIRTFAADLRRTRYDAIL